MHDTDCDPQDECQDKGDGRFLIHKISLLLAIIRLNPMDKNEYIP